MTFGITRVTLVKTSGLAHLQLMLSASVWSFHFSCHTSSWFGKTYRLGGVFAAGFIVASSACIIVSISKPRFIFYDFLGRIGRSECC